VKEEPESHRRGGFELMTPEMVHALVYLAWSVRYLGHTCEYMRSVQDALTRRPVKGDLVVETSLMSWPPDTARMRNFARVGIFDRMEWEPLEGDDPDYGETAYYVTPLDGDEPVRWVNCDFMVLPKTSDEVWKWKHPATPQQDETEA
jgi:hypothetical protein